MRHRGSNIAPHDKGYRATLQENMAAFDSLPKAVRAALANADHNWSAAQIKREMRKPKARRRPELANAKATALGIMAQDVAKHIRDVTGPHAGVSPMPHDWRL